MTERRGIAPTRDPGSVSVRIVPGPFGPHVEGRHRHAVSLRPGDHVVIELDRHLPGLDADRPIARRARARARLADIAQLHALVSQLARDAGHVHIMGGNPEVRWAVALVAGAAARCPVTWDQPHRPGPADAPTVWGV